MHVQNKGITQGFNLYKLTVLITIHNISMIVHIKIFGNEQTDIQHNRGVTQNNNVLNFAKMW